MVLARLIRIPLLLLAFTLVASGCYHATVVTGRTPGTVVIDKPFASGWIYGLVPPSTVEAASECPNGVAMVETELSFVNQLVSALTAGIYTPMHIKVTCASAGSASAETPGAEVIVAEQATNADIVLAFEEAADEAVASGVPVAVRFAQP